MLCWKQLLNHANGGEMESPERERCDSNIKTVHRKTGFEAVGSIALAYVWILEGLVYSLC